MPPTPVRDWRIDVLRSLGAPVTKANLAFLSAWQRQEGGHTNNDAHFNWLNTTTGRSFPAINGIGVRSYPDYGTGIRQTVATLNNGRYRNIVAGLRLGNPSDSALLPAISGDLQVWVSGRRSGNPDYAKKVFTGTAQRNPGGGGVGGFFKETTEQILNPVNMFVPGGPVGSTVLDKVLPPLGDAASHIPIVGGALDAAAGVADAATGVTGAATAVLNSFRWVFGNWDRMLYVLGGFIILMIGLVLMGRALSSSGARVVGGPVGDVANRLQYGPTVVRASRGVGGKRSVVLESDQPAPSRRSGYNPETADIPF